MIKHGRTLRGTMLATLVVAACNDAEPPPAHDMDMPMDMHMEMDPGMMERHADEAEEMASAVRAHVTELRGLPAGEQYERIPEHVSVVARTLGLVDRQMREMSMGMPMDDEEMGAMMGMSAPEHRRMMEGMQALRTEAEALQTASPEEVGERMGPHLDRLEEMARRMDEMAAGMRAM